MGFSSSFEDGQPQPSWSNTVETDASGKPKASGVIGSDGSGIPGNVSDKVEKATANGEYAESGEVADNLWDGTVNSKWLVFATTGWVTYKFPAAQNIKKYALSSANDSPERDPKNWTVQGSTNGTDWTVLDTRTGETFSERFQTKTYDVTTPGSYSWYKLDITLNNGSTNIIQLAEWQLSDGSTTPPSPNMRSVVGSGPTSGYTSKSRAGWTGVKSFRTQGRQTTEGRAYSYNKVFDVDVPVNAKTELSYMIFPEFVTDNLNYPSTYSSVDLAFSDGTYLSDLKARRPARRRAVAAGPGRGQVPVREPVEQGGVHDRRRRGRQDDQADPGRLRQPEGPDGLRRLVRRHPHRRRRHASSTRSLPTTC